MLRLSRLTALALAAFATAAVARPARAQYSLGVSGGLAVPTGRLGDNVNAGYSVGGFVDLRPAPGPLAFRLEVGYDRFDVKNSVLAAIRDATGVDVRSHLRLLRGTASAVLRLPNTSGVRPYLTAGVGLYNLGGSTTFSAGSQSETIRDDTETDFGVNGGIGLELPLAGITPFLEVRAHGVQQKNSTPVAYVPITVGFRF